jgi:hypothetical protein
VPLPELFLCQSVGGIAQLPAFEQSQKKRGTEQVQKFSIFFLGYAAAVVDPA